MRHDRRYLEVSSEDKVFDRIDKSEQIFEKKNRAELCAKVNNEL